MLSSLVAQKKKSRYELIVDLAHYDPNGTPSNKEVISYFSELGLKINSRMYNDYERFKYRGLTRNDQISSCNTDFILFADTDMVYSNRFFYRMIELVTTNDEYRDYEGIMTCGRFSQDNTTIGDTNKFVNNLIKDKPAYVKKIWSFCDSQLVKVKRSNVGAGFFQLINMDKCNHGRLYVDEENCKDYDWEGKGQKAKSDQQFKRKIGIKKKLPKWYSQSQIHLNHFRDNEVGYHIEEQR